MRKRTAAHRQISQKLKSFCSFLAILLLLPYVITVFVHGADRKARIPEQLYVKVEHNQEQNGENEKTVTEVSWKEYLLGVLALEAPENSEPEMLKAQAVLIRTKLYSQVKAEGETIFTERYLDAAALKNKWGTETYEKHYRNLERAVEDTENQVLFYGEGYAWTPFHQASSGMTRSAQEVVGTEDYPYLTAKECPLDKEAEKEMQVVSFSYKEVQAKCQPFLMAVSEEDADRIYGFEDFEIASLDSAGYVKELKIGNTVCSGDEFRDALSLASSSFSIQDKDGKLQVTTMGIGHGLGMSQCTANAMAKEGKTYAEILQFFFEGTELKDAGEIFSSKTE